MDLSSLKAKPADEPALLQLVNPLTNQLIWVDDEKTTPVGFLIYGQDSSVFTGRKRQMMLDAQKARAARNYKEPTAQEMAREELETIVVCVAGYVNIRSDGIDYNGTADKPTTEALFTDYPWMKDQVDRGIFDRSVFMKSS